MHSKNILLLIVVIGIAGVGSLFLGSAVANEEFSTVGIFIAAAMAIALFVGLGKNVWILIPVFAAWQGRINILPIPFSVSNLVVGFAVACWLVLVVTRRENLRIKITGLDVVIGLIIIILALGYLRNPVGIAALKGGGNVGARPYFEVAMALMAYLMLSTIRIDAIWLNRIPWITIAASSILAVGGGIAYLSPDVGIYLYQIYSGFMPNLRDLDTTGGNDLLEVGRAGYLLPMAFAILMLLYGTKAPIANLSPRNPIRIFALGTSIVFTLLSGFRGAIAGQGVYFGLASWVWWRGKGLFVTIALALMTIGSIYVASVLFELPLPVQRTLSFLPGDWNHEVVMQAEGSKDWRIEMWEQAWYEDGIKNKIIGDGFKVPMGELQYYQALIASGRVRQDEKATYYIITGDLHSGPLSAIKYVGIIGLVFFVVLSLVISVRFYKIWRYAIDAKLDAYIGYFALPAMYFPILYIFVFGSFRVDMPRILVSAGMLVLVEKAIRDLVRKKQIEEQEKEKQAEYVENVVR